MSVRRKACPRPRSVGEDDGVGGERKRGVGGTGSAGRELAACKHDLMLRASQRNWRFIDYLLDTPLSRNSENFWDAEHFRMNVAQAIEQRIVDGKQPRLDSLWRWLTCGCELGILVRSGRQQGGRVWL